MLIRVIYLNGTFDMVKPHALARLIDSMRISRFKRRDRWVHLWRDPVRRRQSDEYSGPERRLAG
jgi:hypothetical protein